MRRHEFFDPSCPSCRQAEGDALADEAYYACSDIGTGPCCRFCAKPCSGYRVPPAAHDTGECSVFEPDRLLWESYRAAGG